jgi:hypothetical protein
MPSGKQMLVGGSAPTSSMQAHDGCVQSVSLRHPVRTQVQVEGSDTQTGSLIVKPPSGELLPDCVQVVAPGLHAKGVAHSVSVVQDCAAAVGVQAPIPTVMRPSH